MPYYRNKHETGNVSEYESDEEETVYRKKKLLGTGHVDEVWEFESSDRKSIAIIRPRRKSQIKERELTAKFHFLSAMHPGCVKLIILRDGSYVLRSPKAKGETYEQIGADTFTPIQKMELFLSAIQAVQAANEKGYVVLDLKPDNMFYDPLTKKSTLVDGGTSAQTGRVANEGLYCRDKAEVVTNRKVYHHMAPEFWSTSHVIARESMDVYALGVTMRAILGHVICPIDQMIEACLMKNPTDRPILRELAVEVTDFIALLNDPVVQDFAHGKKRQKVRQGLSFYSQQPEVVGHDQEDEVNPCVLS